MLKGALKAAENEDASAPRRKALASFFATNMAPETTALMDLVINGGDAVLDSDLILGEG